MPHKIPFLKTSRLILRPFNLTDAKDVQKYAGDFSIADTTLNIGHPYEDGMAEAWIKTHQKEFAEKKSCIFAITLAENKKLVGCIAFTINNTHAHAELGYWIAKEFWNKGFATEAGKAMLDYGFNILKLHRVYADHLSRNPASGKVMQKIGMKYEGTLKEHAKKWGKFEDIECYGIINTNEGL